ncbi:MAG: aminotransferase class V-fold PLP-dependent enzyme [Cyclobacteriaceae bacterium]|nr:aminotransferase class V-fold PLP-dependent enzyme [Cyclobacteriaceae bacterium]
MESSFANLAANETVQHEIVAEVKSVCAKMLGAPLSEYYVIFTSNTTEAINLVAGSFAKKMHKTELIWLCLLQISNIRRTTSRGEPFQMAPFSGF